jgi:hypothetical protein
MVWPSSISMVWPRARWSAHSSWPCPQAADRLLRPGVRSAAGLCGRCRWRPGWRQVGHPGLVVLEPLHALPVDGAASGSACNRGQGCVQQLGKGVCGPGTAGTAPRTAGGGPSRHTPAACRGSSRRGHGHAHVFLTGDYRHGVSLFLSAGRGRRMCRPRPGWSRSYWLVVAMPRQASKFFWSSESA